MNLKKACSLRSFTPVACLVAAAVAPSALPTRAAVVSEPVTASKITLNSGATFVAPVGRKAPAYRGRLASVSGNTLTFAGNPGWTVDQFAPVPVYSGGPEFFQYLVILRSDRSADGAGNQGDWWLVDSNTADTLTVEPSGVPFGTTASRLAAGDVVEIIPLTSVKDVFGAGTTLRIAPDTDLDDTTGDFVRFVAGTSFGSSLFYHDGSLDSAGWYLDYANAGDGAKVTFFPDQAVMAFREGAAVDLHNEGTLQSFLLTHYAVSGANALASGFGKDAPLAGSGLQAAGFLDTDFDDTTEDFLRFASGTSFGSSVIYHNGGVVSPAGWYVDFGLDNSVALPTAAGFFLFVDSPITWRQAPPFVP